MKLEDKVKHYKTPQGIKQILNGGRTVFLVGVSGAGKDTVLKNLLKKPDYKLIISHTTRAPRENHGVMERDGVDYHFINIQQAETMLDTHKYVEAKYYGGNIYGTSVAEVIAAHQSGRIAISDIEVQGVEEYHNLSTNITPIFILPPTFEVWIKRLKKRYQTDASLDKINDRLKQAQYELKQAIDKNYYEYVINDTLTKTIKITDEIAHGHLSSTKNALARETAKNLLTELKKYLRN